MSKKFNKIKNEYIQAGLAFARRHQKIAPNYGSDISINRRHTEQSYPIDSLEQNYDSLLETLVIKEEKYAKQGYKPIDFIQLVETYGDSLSVMHAHHSVEKLTPGKKPYLPAKHQQLEVQKYYLDLERDITFKSMNYKRSSS